jgi:hypothetical protein
VRATFAALRENGSWGSLSRTGFQKKWSVMDDFFYLYIERDFVWIFFEQPCEKSYILY